MRQTFSIKAWAALAAGLEEPAQWTAWAEQPYVPEVAIGEVAVPSFPAMSRRRLSLLGKMAVSVADRALERADCALDDIPVVWASRYGDAQRSLELLSQQAQGEPLSPTAFGLSVHNGIAAQHSIARKVHANALCVAAGRYTPEAGVTDALALLAQGAKEVLLVCYDEPLPGAYAQFNDGPCCPFAWAWLLVAAPEVHAPALGMPVMRLGIQAQPQPDTAHAPALPHGLQVLHSMLAGVDADFGHWRWEHVRG